jgi:hypothetical protein
LAPILGVSCTLLVQFNDAPAAAGDGGAGDAGAPCALLANGEYCGMDGLQGYAGSPDDLVSCVDGGIVQTVQCAGGCLAMPSPFPDACNPCVGRADGSYCGRDLPGFPVDDGDFLLQCRGGAIAQSSACSTGCAASDAGSSACFP